ncbi:CD1375 family protein [Enterocloster bolteae]|uniref:CD1375 family protein n=1 Tax=Enterocloster bolteae TaxID=208479 RepID=UPI003AB78A70
MDNLIVNLMVFFMRKDGKEMMAMLWAQQIMLGKKTYEQVPRLLKEKVKEILADSGMEELIEE